jgi:hypothetical protein
VIFYELLFVLPVLLLFVFRLRAERLVVLPNLKNLHFLIKQFPLSQNGSVRFKLE